MSVLRLPIDTKSLHCNIKNDNKSGHTATVATPLKQGSSYDQELGRIFEIPQYKYFETNADLINSINKNARTPIKVIGVFVFDRIAVNGTKIECNKQFCIYVREEIDKSKVQCGRIKVHYPIGFQFEDNELSIDNRSIVNAVSAKLNNYAFFVSAFEYNTDTKLLNFRATIVGEPQVPYSKVFVNEKGVGNKFVLSFTDISDHYDSEVIALRQREGDSVTAINYLDIMNKYRTEAMKYAEHFLYDSDNVTQVRNVGREYPYAPYDFEYIQGNITKYALVFFTATNTVYFSMSSKRVRFCNDFADRTLLVLFTEIAKEPKMHLYTIEEANCFRKDIALIVYNREDNSNE